ncbi:MAG: hypothetical protein ACE5G1_14505, partial [bacterium]
LMGVAVRSPYLIKWILRLVASGLLLRGVAHSILPYVIGRRSFGLLSWIVASSGLLEFLGILIYALLIIDVFTRTNRATRRGAVPSIAPFMGMMLAGWLLYASLNVALLTRMVLAGSTILDAAWNEFMVRAFIGFVLLPVCFTFSLRSFPLFLRLSVPSWNVRAVALTYLFALCLELTPALPPLVAKITDLSLWLSGLGMTLKGGIILWFIWQLDLLTRRNEPWTVNRVRQPGPTRKPTRPGLPDYGEFGRFELLIYAAYFWLALGAVFEMLSGITTLLSVDSLHLNDAIRHMVLLGFVTNLIFGMSVRMIPGFINKKKVARPGLVGATFWLINTAAVARVLPLLLPPSFIMRMPTMLTSAESAFAFSGVFGLIALICLWSNLWKTAHQS